MKEMKCDLCNQTAQGATFEEWMNNLKPHYAEAHADFMKMMGEKPAEVQQAEMKKWMDENKARFEAASE